MDYQDVEKQLLDLPVQFQRFGPIFQAIIGALANGLSRYTTAADRLAPNLYLQNARWGWLDAIGKLYGIPRTQFETDVQYRARILGTLTAPHGSPTSISSFVKLALGLDVSISEDFADVNYQLNFAIPPNKNTLQATALAINWVRPAGVPFLPLFQITGGLFLHTCGYFSTHAVTGSYFSKPHITSIVTIPTHTDNPAALLPTTYLTDPFINGTVT